MLGITCFESGKADAATKKQPRTSHFGGHHPELIKAGMFIYIVFSAIVDYAGVPPRNLGSVLLRELQDFRPSKEFGKGHVGQSRKSFLGKIERTFSVNISMNEFQQLKDLKSLSLRIQSRAPDEQEANRDRRAPSVQGHKSGDTKGAFGVERLDENYEVIQDEGEGKASLRPSIGEFFKGAQTNLSRFIRECRLEGFTRNVLYHQQSLVKVFIIIDAFETSAAPS
ncbi:MAG: hypothetical protein Q9166_000715 [cf. Caloplaca sp. 2 TL-2023]